MGDNLLGYQCRKPGIGIGVVKCIRMSDLPDDMTDYRDLGHPRPLGGKGIDREQRTHNTGSESIYQ